MTGLWLLLAVSVSGAVGAVARVMIESAVASRLDPAGGAPWPAAVVGINITGSFVIGVLAGAVVFHGAPSTLAAVVGTGFCGGFTTFGTASVHTVRLVQERRIGAAGAHLAATVGLSIAACAAGVGLMS